MVFRFAGAMIMLSLVHTLSMRSQSSLLASFAVSTDAADSLTVCAGIVPGASHGIDEALGEAEIPPPPPAGVFDLRFVDPDTARRALGEGSWADLRDGDPTVVGSQQHVIVCRPGAGTSLSVAWELPPGVAAFLDCYGVSPPLRLMATGKGSTPPREAGSLVEVHITLHYNVRVLTARVFLEGAFESRTQRMRQSLLASGVLVAQFPGRTLPSRAVDSIGIAMRDLSAGPGIEEQIALPAWLLDDGTICPFSPPFDAPLIFPDPLRRELHPAFHHRNHLAALCTRPVPAGITACTCDMTSGPELYEGDTAVRLAPSLWGLRVGDADGDGMIGPWDRAAVRAGVGRARVYDRCDVDMNGGVGATDLALVRRVIGAPVKEP